MDPRLRHVQITAGRQPHGTLRRQHQKLCRSDHRHVQLLYVFPSLHFPPSIIPASFRPPVAKDRACLLSPAHKANAPSDRQGKLRAGRLYRRGLSAIWVLSQRYLGGVRVTAPSRIVLERLSQHLRVLKGGGNMGRYTECWGSQSKQRRKLGLAGTYTYPYVIGCFL